MRREREGERHATGGRKREACGGRQEAGGLLLSGQEVQGAGVRRWRNEGCKRGMKE